MPNKESESKAAALIEVAERAGDPEEALACYRSALDHLAPLLRFEKSKVKKLELRKKVEHFVRKAERLKDPHAAASTSVASPVLKSSTFDEDRVRELVQLCAVTPQLKTALEIMQSAELYELEGQYKIALEKYQLALGMLLPALNLEPKGKRRTLLASEIKHWMSRAEAVKEVIAIQEKVIKESLGADSVNDKCVIS